MLGLGGVRYAASAPSEPKAMAALRFVRAAATPAATRGRGAGTSAAGAASIASPPAGGAAPGRRAGAVSTAADVANAAAKTTRNT